MSTSKESEPRVCTRTITGKYVGKSASELLGKRKRNTVTYSHIKLDLDSSKQGSIGRPLIVKESKKLPVNTKVYGKGNKVAVPTCKNTAALSKCHEDMDSHQGHGKKTDSHQGHGKKTDSHQGHGKKTDSPQGHGKKTDSPQGHGKKTDSPQGHGKKTDSPQGHGKKTQSSIKTENDAVPIVENNHSVARGESKVVKISLGDDLLRKSVEINNERDDLSGKSVEINNEREEPEATTSESKSSYSKTNKGWQCLVCKALVNSRANVIVHMRTHTGEKPYRCEICQRQFAVKVNYTRHCRRHLDVKPFPCSHCNKAYSEKRHLDHHMISNHTEEGLSKRIKKPRPTSKMCDVCGKTFSTPYYVTVHMRVHTGEKPFKCPHCPREFRSQSNHSNHLQIHHKETLPRHQCQFCSKSFLTEDNLNRHFKLIHSMTPDNRRNQGSVNLKPQCPSCNVTFTSFYQLTKHNLCVHEKRDLLQCDKCGKNFLWLSQLRAHADQHKQAHTFKCTVCHKGFYRKRSLQQHMPIHLGQKPHKCHLCQRAFLYPSSLRTHRLGAHVNKSWSCPQCGRTFKHPASLSRHQAYHRGQREHACRFCSRTYITKGDLRRHEKTQHLEQLTFHEMPQPLTQPAISEADTERKGVVCSTCGSVLANDYAHKRHDKFCMGNSLPAQRSILVSNSTKNTPDVEDVCVSHVGDGNQDESAGITGDNFMVLQDSSMVETIPLGMGNKCNRLVTMSSGDRGSGEVDRLYVGENGDYYNVTYLVVSQEEMLKTQSEIE